MTEGASFIEQNTRERERLRALVERMGEAELNTRVNEQWTVADELGHVAFWDARALFLGRKLQRGEPVTPSDEEPEDVDWINDAAHALVQAIPVREVARLAVRLAEETDELMASIAPDRTYPGDPASPVNALRATHRGEHLDQIEAALGRGT